MNGHVSATKATGGFAGRALVALAAVAAASVFAIQAVNGQTSAAGRRYINGVYAPLPDEKRLNELYEAARRDSKYVDLIRRVRDGWNSSNVDAAMASATEDTQMIDITDAGPSIKFDGKEQMRAAVAKGFTGRPYSAAGKWIPEKSGGETWGIYQNVKVGYQYSTYVREDGTEWTRPTIVVVEYKEGKRWREWRFFPVDR